MSSNNQYQRRWYSRNPELKKKQVREREAAIKAWVKEYRSGLKCERCGEAHPATLDFHHLDPSQKDVSISRVHKNGWSIERIKSEMEKCEILCSNCHRKEHYEIRSRGETADALRLERSA